MAPRRFSLDEAERLLPRLSGLLLRLQELKREHDQLQEQAREIEGKMASDGHLLEAGLNQARQAMVRAAAEVSALIEEVQALGCELKDIDQGLVDFRTVVDGREVYLCWKLGEPAIAWWHELQTGFAGRQPLPERS
ncbi:MAG: DUF2203 domain-containing protein [Chloroflexi bacterium]|nr:DUF2203 domain-containing protein [Chloroflexota bacterium]